jgi:type VI secretion system secreted protein VgrG
MTLKQASRSCALHTPLGEDVLVLYRMTGTEELGHMFEYKIEALSENHNIQSEKILGKNVSVRLDLVERENPRYFNGFVAHFSYAGMLHDYAYYRIIVRPWLWLLDQWTDCRIFQNKNIRVIMDEVLTECGFKEYEYRLSEEYSKHEFWVQYKESVFNFFSRKMEHEGIYYYFTHEKDKHRLVLADSLSAHDFVRGYEEIPYLHPNEDSKHEGNYISDWHVTKDVRPGTYSLSAFDFLRPKVNLQVRRADPQVHDFSNFEHYDYCYDYVDRDLGERYARIRLEESHVEFERAYGRSHARGLGVGALFHMVEHPREDQNRWYLIVSAAYEIKSDHYFTLTETEPIDPYVCDFMAIDSSRPYRSARTTPQPIIKGPQTAIVVGKTDEEIWTNEHACVKLHFPWDNRDNRDENSSCWVRVAQIWAGKGWGWLTIPRIGHEVIVEFLEGNPDKPIVTGRVYNGDCGPPYALPEDKTQSGIKTSSSLGGEGLNEIRFQDLKDSEEINVHAQKDLTVHVRNSENRSIESGSSTTAGSISQASGSVISQTAGANITRTADDDIVDKAGKNMSTETVKNMSLKSGGSYQLSTNLGIHLKAMNFVAAAIESGAKAAANAIKRGAATTGVATVASAGQAGATGGDAGSAGLSQAGDSAATTGMQALSALSPGIEAGAAELTRLSNQAAERADKLSEPVNKAIEASDALGKAIESGASPEAVAAAFMAMADAVAQAIGDAKALIDGLLPQIPSIVLWAMKDINGLALWSITFQSKVRDITLQAQNRHIHVKAKQQVNLEAETKDLNIKAGKKNVLITGKEKIDIKAEDKDLTIEAGKEKVFIKSPKQIFLKCGKASISMAESGNIVIKGAKVNITGSSAVQVRGKPIKLN